MKTLLSLLFLPIYVWAQDPATLQSQMSYKEPEQNKRFRVGLLTPNMNFLGAEAGVYLTQRLSLGLGGGSGKYGKDDKTDKSIPHDYEIRANYSWNQLSLRYDFPIATGFTIAGSGGAEYYKGQMDYKYSNTELVGNFFKYNQTTVKGTNKIDIDTYAYFAKVDFMYTVFFEPVNMTLETGGGLTARSIVHNDYEITLPSGAKRTHKLSDNLINSAASTFVNFIF